MPANQRGSQLQPNGRLSRGTHAYPGANGATGWTHAVGGKDRLIFLCSLRPRVLTHERYQLGIETIMGLRFLRHRVFPLSRGERPETARQQTPVCSRMRQAGRGTSWPLPACDPSASRSIFHLSLLLDAGIFGSNVVREVPCFFQAMAKEGRQGGQGDKHEVGQPQPIHDPGIQQEPCVIF